jgi:carboxypeptidase Taq
MTTTAAYTELEAKLRQAHLLASIGELLGWDEQVNLPSKSVDQRAAQRSVLAGVQHAAATDARVGELLAVLEKNVASLTDDQRVVISWARRDYDRATKLPAEFVREKAEQGSRGYHAWKQAREQANFSLYAPVLAKNLELAKREAAHLNHGDAPYDYMIDRHDPGMTAATTGALFAELKQELVPLVRQITASPVKATADLLKGFPVADQEVFLREVTKRIGFDRRFGASVLLRHRCRRAHDDSFRRG